MTPAQVRAAIGAGTPAPIYLLESDDVPSRLELAQAFLALVEDGLQAFNTASFHAREATAAADRDAMFSAIISAARTLPMMAPRRVLLVHDAEAILAPKRAKDDDGGDAPAAPGSGKRRARVTTPAEDFEAYVERPEPLTTLVLDTASLDRGRRITKLLIKHAIVVDCGTLTSPAEAARWIKGRLDQDEMTMDGPAVTALLDAAGLHLPRIRSAIDKLVLYAAGEGAITAGHVRDVVLPVEEPGEDFALGKAIWNGNPAAALREIDAEFEAGGVAPMILGQIRAAVIRLRPDARARQALRAVLETDLAIKSSQGEPRFVLERLVVEVCGGGAAGAPARRPWA
ncbi:MAG: DNA polymerase III subunit delta [Acidobacteriota bacterium]